MSRVNKIFPPEDCGYQRFGNLTMADTVLEGEVMHITVVGLRLGDRVEIEQRITVTDCEELWAPFKLPTDPCCPTEECHRTSGYSYPTTDFFIPVEGEYRFVLVASDDATDDNPSYFDGVKVFSRKIKCTPCLSTLIKI